MGRLEDIVQRNTKPRGNRERVTVGIGLGLFLLLIIFLIVFTDLGIPSDDGATQPEPRVPDVQLRAPGKSSRP